MVVLGKHFAFCSYCGLVAEIQPLNCYKLFCLLQLSVSKQVGISASPRGRFPDVRRAPTAPARTSPPRTNVGRVQRIGRLRSLLYSFGVSYFGM